MKTKFDTLESVVEGKYRVINVEGDQVLAIPESGSCRICGDLTTWISVSFMGSFYCSVECLDKEWQGYFEACNNAP